MTLLFISDQMPPLSRPQVVVAAILYPAALVCIISSGFFEAQAHARSGIPIDHYAVRKDGRLYYTDRSHPKFGKKVRVSITQQQFDVWKFNTRVAAYFGLAGVLCGFGIGGILAYNQLRWNRKHRPRKDFEERGGKKRK